MLIFQKFAQKFLHRPIWFDFNYETTDEFFPRRRKIKKSVLLAKVKINLRLSIWVASQNEFSKPSSLINSKNSVSWFSPLKVTNLVSKIEYLKMNYIVPGLSALFLLIWNPKLSPLKKFSFENRMTYFKLTLKLSHSNPHLQKVRCTLYIPHVVFFLKKIFSWVRKRRFRGFRRMRLTNQ